MRRPAVSLEEIRVSITEAQGNVISASTVQIAFIPDYRLDPEPEDADWLDGTWEDTPASTRIVTILNGPTGDVTLARGRYRIYVKFADNPEIPAIPCGWITIGM